MPNLVVDLDVNRVDLVDEGACSAAFIELYKRKEKHMDVKEILSKMKPEHAAVIEDAIGKAKTEATTAMSEKETAQAELTKAKEDLAAALKENEILKAKQKECGENSKKECGENSKKECGENSKKGESSFDEEETMKSMPEPVRQMFAKMKAQKEAAEEELRKSKEAEIQSKAVAKAAQLKALPVETEKLVEVLKGCSPELLDMLTTINAAIEGTVLDEVGKSAGGSAGADAWSKIEAKAEEVAKRANVTKQKAVSIAIKENPDLYKEYLQGGAK